MSNTQTATTTIRETARQSVIEQATEYCRLSHERDYSKLHVYRDGSVRWNEFNNESSDIIDSDADHFCAIQSVATVGTGSYCCNCQHCNEVYNAVEEERAIEDGRKYDKDSKYATFAEAITDAIGASDIGEVEEMLAKNFDAIEVGYFTDEAV